MSRPDPLVVRPLTPGDDRSRFCSGNIELDRFFQRYAGQNQLRRQLGTTWVAGEGGTICGFATVSAAHLELEELPVALRARLPAYPLPVLRLARLAVAQGAQGRGVGRRLLQTVFHLARQMAADFGCVGIVVDAKAEAADFYRALGFQPLACSKGALGDRPAPLPMFLPLRSLPG